MPKEENRRATVDICGVGLNATDTIIRVPRFPAFNSKLEFESATNSLGGQVASALVACRRWRLSARYVGSIGDDAAGKLHAREFRAYNIESHLFRHRHCSSLRSFIIVDAKSGERTVLSKQDPRLPVRPSQLRREWVENSRLLLVDGHDTAAARRAAQIARTMGIPVVADLDKLYSGVKVLLESVDYLFASQDFPTKLTKRLNLLESLPEISRRFGCRISGATLGSAGALAWDGRRFCYSPGFRVRAVDTTGAGDIFHAGIAYGILRSWDIGQMLEFSNAAAALNCTALGARGGIASLARVRRFMLTGRRSKHAFSASELRRHEQR
jgi:sulfofructose kinase